MFFSEVVAGHHPGGWRIGCFRFLVDADFHDSLVRRYCSQHSPWNLLLGSSITTSPVTTNPFFSSTRPEAGLRTSRALVRAESPILSNAYAIAWRAASVAIPRFQKSTRSQ